MELNAPIGAMPLDAQPHGLVGQPLDRVDGPLKVTGRATYAYEFRELPGILYGYVVEATIGKGAIRSLDVAAAEASRRRVVAVITHLNATNVAPGRQGRGQAQPDEAACFRCCRTTRSRPTATSRSRWWWPRPSSRPTGRGRAPARRRTSARPRGAFDLRGRAMSERQVHRPTRSTAQPPDTSRRTTSRPAYAAAAACGVDAAYHHAGTSTTIHDGAARHAGGAGTARSCPSRIYDRQSRWPNRGARRTGQGASASRPRTSMHVLLCRYVGGAFGGQAGAAWSHVILAAMASRAAGASGKGS